MAEPERGVVLRGTGGVWHVHTEGGATRDAALRGRLKLERRAEERRGDERRGERAPERGERREGTKLAVGDEVLVERDERGTGWLITEILPRRSKLARRSPGGAFGERVVIANVDQVVVVFAAAEPEPSPRMLDRFLVIAEANGIPARIVVNKVELAGEEAARARFADHERAGYPLHLTSAKRGTGLAELRAALIGAGGARRVSALAGPSGVGKSSLLNAMFPGLELRVGEISRSVLKGRHTTVGADMHPLAEGAYVADTPGLREVGVWELPPDELDRCFPELRPHLGHCRFDDCAHRAEPGCEVRAAVERGEVSPARYESYLKLRAELEDAMRDWRGW
jgi:ribosome biogenesis GTPase